MAANKITKATVDEMLEEGIDDEDLATSTIEELSDLITSIFEAVRSGDDDALDDLKEQWES